MSCASEQHTGPLIHLRAPYWMRIRRALVNRHAASPSAHLRWRNHGYDIFGGNVSARWPSLALSPGQHSHDHLLPLSSMHRGRQSRLQVSEIAGKPDGQIASTTGSFDIEEIRKENNALIAEIRSLVSQIQQLEVQNIMDQSDDGEPVLALLRNALILLPDRSPMSSLALDFKWNRLSGEEVVEGVINILQQTLDDESIDPTQHKEVLRLLLRTSMTFSVLPSSYYIQGVVCNKSEPHRMGGFADVYRAACDGRYVAVKVVRMFSTSPAEDSDPIQSAFLREIVVSRQVVHPFIQSFWGVDRVSFAPRLGLITPWQQHGNVNEAMETLTRDNTEIPYNQWLLQIAQGLQHLHSMGIVHGDLRGANILIDELLHPRLADFGLSILADAYTRTLGSHSGVAVRWSPPELLSGDILRPNFASDVYAFGCTCIELYGRRKPFYHISSDVQVVYQLALGAQPERPNTGQPMPDTLWHLVEQCLDKDPARRPTVAELVRNMEIIAHDGEL